MKLHLQQLCLVFVFLRCVFAQVDTSRTYEITVGGRVGCNDFLSVASCGSNLVDLFGVDDGSGRQHFNFVPIPNAPDTYNIMVAGGRDGCNLYLSTASCPSNLVDLFGVDDGSGRQRWVVKPISGASGAVNIVISGGRDGCNDMLSVADCASGTNLVDMFTGDDGSGHQQFVLTPVSSSSSSSSSTSSSTTTSSQPASSSSSSSSSSSPALATTPQSSSSQSSTSSPNSLQSSSSSSSSSASSSSNSPSFPSQTSPSSPQSPTTSSESSTNGTTTGQSAASSSTSSSNSNTGAIAGGVIGAVVVVLIVAAIWWWTRKRQESRNEMMVEAVNPFHHQPQITPSSPDQMQQDWGQPQYVVPSPPASNAGSLYQATASLYGSSTSGGGGAPVAPPAGAPAGRRNSMSKNRHRHDISQSTSPSSGAGGGVDGTTESETEYLRRRVEQLAAENATLQQQNAVATAAPPAYH